MTMTSLLTYLLLLVLVIYAVGTHANVRVI